MKCSTSTGIKSSSVSNIISKYDMSQPNSLSLELLKRFFGHSKFRPFQWEIICNALNRIDQLVIMSTGTLFVSL